MPELTAALAPDVLAACQAGLADVASAFSRTLDAAATLTPGTPGAYADGKPAGFEGAGLVVLLKASGAGMAIILPESTALVPGWCAAPDATGASKLSTFAQELSMLVVPETLAIEHFAAARVSSLAAALIRAGVAADAALVPLEIVAGERTGQVSLVWPVADPDSLFDPAPAADAPATASAAAAAAPKPAPAPAAPRPAPRKPKVVDFSQLPGYSRSLLKVVVPVSVRLAAKKENIQEVVEIVPGSIIKFEKGCDELLQMVIGGRDVAEGEAVKIGDKFGFRVTSMLMPSESFAPLRRQAGA